MKNNILTTIFLLLCITCLGQKKVTWKDLSKVKFTDKYFPEYDDYFLYPEFSNSIKNLEGKTITITGYFLNLDPKGKIYILSKGPMSSCYFCGVGGPETAVELQISSKLDYKTDTIVAVTGKLSLNDTDVEHFNYILTNCKVEVVK